MRVDLTTSAARQPHSVPPSPSATSPVARASEPLARAIEALRYSVEGSPPIGAHKGALQGDVARYIERRKHFNDAAALDWLSNDSYADRRRAELSALPGGEIPAAQFGLSITKEGLQSETFAPRLRFNHDGSGGYHRMTPSGSLADKCRALYEAKFGKVAPGFDVIFVNSKNVAKKLSSGLNTLSAVEQLHNAHTARSMFSPRLRMHNLLPSRTKPYTEVSPGLFAVKFESSHSKAEMENRLIQLGARVSPYLIERALRKEQIAPWSMPNVDNVVSLKQFNEAVAGPMAELAALPDQHPASAQGGVIVALITDLQTMLDSGKTLNRHRHDPVLRNALQALGNQLQTLPTQQHDNQRFGNAYIAIMEELKVILSVVRPYDQAAYKKAATEQVLTQLDPETKAQLGSAHISTFMTTSGISAIGEGLEAARALSGKNEIDVLRDSTGKGSPLYFEVPGLLSHNGTTTKAGASTLYATLNPNTLAQGDWGGGKAIADALRPQLANRDRKHPLTLVLDRTMERREDMPALMKELAPAIAAGHLRVLLCKSHQKFSSMGSAKVAAGNLMLLAAPDQKTAKVIGLLEKNEEDLEWMAADELQLMTHFLRSGQQEYALFDKAVANADFLRKHCFSSPEHAQLVDFSERLPVVQTNGYMNDNAEAKWPKFSIKPAQAGVADEVINMHPTVALSQALIHCRGSFGLPTTNFMDIADLPGYDGGAFRFSLGQESHAELIENFYMFSRVMRLGKDPMDCSSICAHIHTLIDQGLSTEQKLTQAPMSLVQKLSTIGRNEAPALDNQDRLTGSVATMRAALKKERTDQRFTLNKIVSTLGVLETIAGWKPINLENSRERPQLDAMLEGLIKSGMPGVSATGRNLIFSLQARLCQHDLQAPNNQTRAKAVEVLIATMERADVARLYFMGTCKIPDKVMAEHPPSQQQKLVEFLFKPLSTEAKKAFLERHQQLPGYEQFATACAQSIVS